MSSPAVSWWSTLQCAPKLVCLARTFPKHAKELGNDLPEQPIFFLKSCSSIIGDKETIVLPEVSKLVHHEAEVALVISRPLRFANKVAAAAAIGGFTVLNDITARDIQHQDQGRFSRAKSFDTFCPLSSEFLTEVRWEMLSVGCSVNQCPRQHGALTQMWMTPPELVSWLSYQFTLNRGDVISLGTPSGVGPIESGDELITTLYVDDAPCITLTNPVAARGAFDSESVSQREV